MPTADNSKNYYRVDTQDGVIITDSPDAYPNHKACLLTQSDIAFIRAYDPAFGEKKCEGAKQTERRIVEVS